MIEITPELEFQVKEVLRHSQDVENPQVEELLKTWKLNKTNISNTFLNGEMRMRHPKKISFQLDDKVREDRYRSFVDTLAESINNDDFIHFLDILTAKEFYENSVSSDLTLYDGKKMQKGTKVIKSFKYFITDGALLADIQNRASMIIQEDKVEGYLCMSVHPLDFLSSSENNYNWRSCHSLDGEYRAGNLSYMMDASTVICYLEADEPSVLPRFPASVPWNDKKWRCLLHFDTKLNAVFAGRQYPFFSPGALELIRDLFFEGPKERAFRTKFSNDMFIYPITWTHWNNWNVHRFPEGDRMASLYGKYIPLGFKLYDMYDIIKDVKNSKHFNDLIKSTVYEDPYYMSKIQNFAKPPKFEIGAPVPCIDCGNEYVEGYDTMVCPNCGGEFDEDLYVYCECCQSRIYRDEAVWVEDQIFCKECADRESFVCPTCNERAYNCNQRWDEELKDYICKWCYDTRRGGEE